MIYTTMTLNTLTTNLNPSCSPARPECDRREQSRRVPLSSVSAAPAFRSPPKRSAKEDEGRLEAARLRPTPWRPPPPLSFSHPHPQTEMPLHPLLSIFCRWDIATTSTITPLLSSITRKNRQKKEMLFMQNEPNLNIWKLKLSSLLIKLYAIFAAPNVKKNKPKRTQNEPIFHPSAQHAFFRILGQSFRSLRISYF